MSRSQDPVSRDIYSQIVLHPQISVASGYRTSLEPEGPGAIAEKVLECLGYLGTRVLGTAALEGLGTGCGVGASCRAVHGMSRALHSSRRELRFIPDSLCWPRLH